MAKEKTDTDRELRRDRSRLVSVRRMYGNVIVCTYYNEYWVHDTQLLQWEDGNIHYAVFGQEETILL